MEKSVISDVGTFAEAPKIKERYLNCNIKKYLMKEP